MKKKNIEGHLDMQAYLTRSSFYCSRSQCTCFDVLVSSMFDAQG